MPSPAESPPPSLQGRLGYLLKHAHLRLREHTEPALAPLGVNGRELAVLIVLGGSRPLAQQEAAVQLGVDRTTMVDLIDQLQDKGLVVRRPDSADRRRNLVHLTTKGERVLDHGNQTHRQAEAEFLSALEPAEAEQLRAMLQRVLGLTTAETGSTASPPNAK